MRLRAKDIKKIIVRYTFVHGEGDEQEDITAGLGVEFDEHMTASKKTILEIHENVAQAFKDTIEDSVE